MMFNAKIFQLVLLLEETIIEYSQTQGIYRVLREPDNVVFMSSCPLYTAMIQLGTSLMTFERLFLQLS
jgi:hypothetical protein